MEAKVDGDGDGDESKHNVDQEKWGVTVVMECRLEWLIGNNGVL